MKRYKPTKSMQSIISYCAPVIEHLDTANDETIDICPARTPRVIFLLDGQVEVRRQHDDLLISTVRSPYIMGAMVNEVENFYYYIQVKEGARLGVVDYDVFIKNIREGGLWYDIMEITSHITSFLIHRDISLVNKSSYQVVVHYLQEVAMLDDAIRLKTPVYSYILQRSGLSRSGVLSILSALRRGGYVTIRNGIMLDIADKIPYDY